MIEVSIILPGYRDWEWKKVYESCKDSLNGVSFELIIVGPENNSGLSESNVRFIKDFGAPGRCFQIGASLASGKYLTWICDDGVALPGALKNCYDLIEEINDTKHIICQNYYEGGDIRVIDFFRARYHQGLRMPGVKESYLIAIMFMCNTEYFKELGGLDCRFEHVNMNIHDFVFRAQNNGSKVSVYMPPVFNISWDVHAPSYVPVRRAYEETDLPLFTELYNIDQSERILIPFCNWEDSPPVWEKRFGKV